MDDPAQSRLERQRHESEGGHPKDQKHQDEGNAAVEAQEAQGHTYGVINISGNAQAILGNVDSSQGDFFRRMDHANSKNMLIKALYFEGMQSRKQQISARAGSPKHVEWIWKTNFVTWLGGAGSFYWITGLPGSGKSTLMRHICESRRTIDTLQMSGHKWVTSHFFFDFRVRDGMANSIEGMLRALLYQLVKRLPGVLDQIDHTLFTEVSQTSNLDACLDTLCEAVRSMSMRVCAFIDGLDEFEGSAARLLEVLHSLEDRGDLKLCLASRPYPIFKNDLSNFPTLVMQDHNDESIRLYTESQWEAHRLHASLPKSLSNKIRERARGIFLWARLATDELYRDCIAGKSVEELEEQLELMPKEVEEMYQRILDRLPKALRLEAAVLLYIISGEKGHIHVRKLYVALQAVVEKLGPGYSVLSIDLDATNVHRILAVLGDFLEVSTATYSTAPSPDELSKGRERYIPPRISFEKQRIQLRRDSTAIVSLTHETLSSFLDRRSWLKENLPMTIYNSSRRYFWLDLYMEELSVHLVAENAESRQLNPKTIGYIERTEKLWFRRSRSRQHEPELLSLLNSWPRWTALLCFALQEILNDQYCMDVADDYRVARLRRILLSENFLLHCAICVFRARDMYVNPGSKTGFPLPGPNTCNPHGSYEPLGISHYAEHIRWDVVVALGHGFMPYIETQIDVHPSMSMHQSQNLFNFLWQNYLNLNFDYSVRRLLNILMRAGCLLQGTHLCGLFERSSQGFDPDKFLVDFIAEHLCQEKLHHSSECDHFRLRGGCSSLLCDWAADVWSVRMTTQKLRRLLKSLLDRGQDINHVCEISKATVLNTVLSPKDKSRGINGSRLRKLVIALQMGADPHKRGAYGTAFDAARKLIATQKSSGWRKHSKYTNATIAGRKRMGRRILDVLEFFAAHNGNLPLEMDEYVDFMVDEAGDEGEDEVFTSLEALSSPAGGKPPSSYLRWIAQKQPHLQSPSD